MYKSVLVTAPRKTQYFADAAALTQEIERVCNELGHAGYVVFSVMPFNRADAEMHLGVGGVSAWSFTDAAIVSARLEADNSIPPKMR